MYCILSGKACWNLCGKRRGELDFSALPWKESGQKATIIEKFGKGSLRFKGQKGFAYVEEAEKGIM